MQEHPWVVQNLASPKNISFRFVFSFFLLANFCVFKTFLSFGSFVVADLKVCYGHHVLLMYGFTPHLDTLQRHYSGFLFGSVCSSCSNGQLEFFNLTKQFPNQQSFVAHIMILFDLWSMSILDQVSFQQLSIEIFLICLLTYISILHFLILGKCDRSGSAYVL